MNDQIGLIDAFFNIGTLCLILAFLLGLIIGWLLKHLFGGDANINGGDTNELNRLRSENASLVSKLNSQKSSASLVANDTDELNRLREENADLTSKLQAHSQVQAVPSVQFTKEDLEDDYDIEEVEGIGPGYGKRLRKLNINRTLELLEKGSEKESRAEIAKGVDLEAFVIDKWVSMSDLLRLPGVRGQFAELLEASGVKSVHEMASLSANAVAEKMKITNDKEHRIPFNRPEAEMMSEWTNMAADWIKSAKDLKKSTDF